MSNIKKSYSILNMSCASCASHAQHTLKNQEGVIEAQVNFATSNAIIEFNPKITNEETLKKSIDDAGYEMILPKEDSPQISQIKENKLKSLEKRTFLALFLSIPVAIIGMFFMHIPYANYIMWILSTPVIFGVGKYFFIGAWKQAKNKNTNMDTLVAISTCVAYIFSVFNTLFPKFWTEKGLVGHVYFEAATVIIAFISLGKLLEEKAKNSTSSAIEKLMGLQPKTVTIIDENNIEKQKNIEDVLIGEKILVKPGEKIPVDGIVTQGNSYVDESMISGEPIPVSKKENSKVFAGTINQKGSFHFKAEKIGSETLLAQIIKMVQDAQNSKAPVQKLVDKIAGIFVPVVILIAISSALIWFIWGGQNNITQAIMAFVTVLIIACPCALGLATPTAIMVGIGKAAENGILIKNAESLELAKKIDAIILDKTGTITIGKPTVTDEFWLNGNNENKSILVSLEKKSEHPISQAIVNHYSEENIEIKNFQSVTGKGIYATYKNETYFVGNPQFIKEQNVLVSNEIQNKTDEYENQAKTVIYFSDSKEVLAVIAISDAIKPTSENAIKKLQESGIDIYMLTGDNPNTAKAVSEAVGIKNYYANTSPQDKNSFVKDLQKKGKVVAMIGDGINDSAALASADVSIAMGKGSDIAMDVAHMTIISSDLNKIPLAIKLSKQTVATIKQNLFWAFIYNIIGIPLAAGILYPINGFLLDPMIAGAAMALSSTSVVLNSLILKRKDVTS